MDAWLGSGIVWVQVWTCNSFSFRGAGWGGGGGAGGDESLNFGGVSLWFDDSVGGGRGAPALLHKSACCLQLSRH